MRTWITLLAPLLVAVAAPGCGGGTVGPADGADSAIDIRPEGSTDGEAEADGDRETSADGDGGPDGGPDSEPDAEPDAAADAGPDAVPDVVPDAVADGAPDAVADDADGEAAPDVIPDDCDETKLPTGGPYDFLEFCVPADPPGPLAEVEAIIAGLADARCWRGSSGRIRCDRATEYICTIPADTPLAVLCRLTLLAFIERIAGSFWE
jgi:hypothetical protein